MIALLTCLEALLGVVNACLPVMNPILNKLSETRVFAFLSTWTSAGHTGKPSHTSRSIHNHASWARKTPNWSANGGPREIEHQSSRLVFTQNLASDVGSPIGSSPTSPQRLTMKHHLPTPAWNDDSFEKKNRNAIHVQMDWDAEQQTPWDQLPTYPSRQLSSRGGTRWYGRERDRSMTR